MNKPVHVSTLLINGHPVAARDDRTILDVAKENGFFIPTLCHFDGLSEVGSCRLCLVEVKGYSRLLPACSAYVHEGMEVVTESETLSEYRRTILEMLFAEGNHVCSVCVSNGHCELQWLAQKLGLDHLTMPYRFPHRNVDASHKQFILDRNRCTLCTRCIRVCEEVENAHNWDVMGRGIRATLVSDLNQPWGATDFCLACGKCVQVCPTGALSEKGRAVGEMIKHRRVFVKDNNSGGSDTASNT
ncbi:MAG: bidirectional hydrogenase complex protein HoxU [Anaerolineae bacterium]|nr:bidirectional hydrogenase complex protein HoxU [Anaerolineae bacterium]